MVELATLDAVGTKKKLAEQNYRQRTREACPAEYDWMQAELHLLFLKTLVSMGQIIEDLVPRIDCGAAKETELGHDLKVAEEFLDELRESHVRESTPESIDAIACTCQMLDQLAGMFSVGRDSSGGATAEAVMEDKEGSSLSDVLLRSESAGALCAAIDCDSKGANAMEKERLATIYGPVGWIEKEPGERVKVRLQKQWKSVETAINARLVAGSAFVGPDRVARSVDDVSPTSTQIEALGQAISDRSEGDLFVVCLLPAEGDEIKVG